MRRVLWQREGVENVLDGNDEILAAVEFIGHGRGEQPSADVEVPEGFAGGGVKSEEIAGIVGGEEEMSGGG